MKAAPPKQSKLSFSSKAANGNKSAKSNVPSNDQDVEMGETAGENLVDEHDEDQENESKGIIKQNCQGMFGVSSMRL